MYQKWLLKIISSSGLESKELEFDNIYWLFDYIKKHDNPGYFEYKITKRVGYVKS